MQKSKFPLLLLACCFLHILQAKAQNDEVPFEAAMFENAFLLKEYQAFPSFSLGGILDHTAITGQEEEKLMDHAVLGHAQSALFFSLRKKDHQPRNYLSIGTDPLLLASVGRLNLTPEYKLDRNTGIGVELGFSRGAWGLLHVGSGKIDRTALSGNIYFRKYDHKELKRSVFYGAGISLGYETFFRANDWYKQGNRIMHYEAAAIKKQSFGAFFQLGKRSRTFGKLYLDRFLELGARASKFQHSAVDVTPISMPILGGIMSQLDRRNGWHMAPIIRLGMRVNLVVVRK